MKLLNAVLSNKTIQAIDKLLGEELVGQVDNLLKDFSLDISKEKLILKTKIFKNNSGCRKFFQSATALCQCPSFQFATVKKTSVTVGLLTIGFPRQQTVA